MTKNITEKITLLVPRGKTKTVEGIFELECGLEAEVAVSIHKLNKTHWNQCVPENNLFLQAEFLGEFEDTANTHLEFRYVLLRAGNKPAGVLYYQVIHLTADEIGYILRPVASSGSGLAGQWTEWVRRLREQKGFRVLISGNNFISGEYGIAISKNGDPVQVMDAFAETAKLIAKNDRNPAKISAILVKDYFPGSTKMPVDRLKKKHFHRFQVEPEMIVPLNKSWITFQDYVNAMSKKYRNRLKMVYKISAALKLVEMDESMLRKKQDEINQLYLNVHRRAKFRLAALGEKYFAGMKAAFPDKFRVTGYFLENKLVAFRSSFLTENHLEAHFIGIDYSLNAELNLYQRILYDFVSEGILSGVPAVFLGRTAAEIKSTVGAEPHDLVCFIRHRNNFSNQVIRPFIDYLQPSDWIPRNPFTKTIETVEI
ncbi:MAG TPA: hypothetical protein VI731_12460 [Bacteroidia bacterium]|nr:hypothetical protein [Bacteroidia bacterium]